jgi:porin
MRSLNHFALIVGLRIVLIVLLAFARHASAQAPYAVPPTWGGPLLERPRLTGNWDGVRDEMGKKGVVLDVDLTQVPQFVTGGGRETYDAYSGLLEYTLNMDSQKMGLWPGAFLNVQGMTNFGTNVGFASGTFIPANVTAILPQPGETTTGLMSFAFAQYLSNSFGLVLGKLSGLGADANAFAHDYHSQFLNGGFAFNMTLAEFPLTSYGGAMVWLPTPDSIVTLSAIDPNGSAVNDSLHDLFAEGVNLAAEGRLTIKPGGLVGHQLLGYVWSNQTRALLQQDPANSLRLLVQSRFPRLADPGPLRDLIEKFFPALGVPPQPLATSNTTWAFYYNFDQYLWSPSGQPDKGIGIFGRFGVADDKTNPVKYAYNLGISGNGVVPSRPSDQFGVGWSRVNISGNLLPFLREKVDIGLDHEDTIEAYYNASLTPAVGLAADLQVTNPALKKFVNRSNSEVQNMSTAWIVGLRIYVRF